MFFIFSRITIKHVSHFLDTLDSNHNVFCKPIPKVVAVKGNGLPYFVELHQCQGSIRNYHPKQKNCTFAKYNEVKIQKTHSNGQGFITLKNHTECKEQCANECLNKFFERNETSCVCTCPHTREPEGHKCPKNKM